MARDELGVCAAAGGIFGSIVPLKLIRRGTTEPSVAAVLDWGAPPCCPYRLDPQTRQSSITTSKPACFVFCFLDRVGSNGLVLRRVAAILFDLALVSLTVVLLISVADGRSLSSTPCRARVADLLWIRG